MGMMNEVQVGRFQHMLERLLSMKGEVGQQQLSPEIMPVLDVGSPPPAWYALGNERLCWGYANQAAVAGENSSCGIWNTANTGVIATVEQVFLRASATSEVQAGHLDSVSGGGYTQGASGFRDSRFPRGSLAAAVQTYAYHAVGSPITTVLWRSAATSVPIYFDLPVVLAPGSGLFFYNQTVNTQLVVSLLWRERKIEDSESSVG